VSKALDPQHLALPTSIVEPNRRRTFVDTNGLSREEYTERILEAYRETPGTTGFVRKADRLVASGLFERGIPLMTIKNALCLAAARRVIRPKDALPLQTVRSLAYFLSVVDEVLETQMGQEYFDYLRSKLRTVGKKAL
jgi:hypothetical protein